ncbi:HEAT repeat domain-containing protein [Natronorubrum halophilum]|uniref:HEAT repeat domain-containing protein n=1 Tax=Natronorubrum halophilum TaxID=1702106 RepID=UPI0010C16AEF|nr:HEAT repeat domain-containing protein [Natronorubrum halophilum]
MDDPTQTRAIDQLNAFLDGGDHEEAKRCLERLRDADTGTRKTALRALRQLGEERPTALEPVLEALTPFLTDEERSIRLTTAKLFVAIAEAEPDATAAVVSPLADRLADEDEFYYVRARSAEALGYVALEHPTTVASPEVLADLRVGLSFDEPEVREKLAKTLEYVALGDQDRLRHHVADLTRHLTDSNEFVRYHLCTALVAIGCTYPSAVSESVDELSDRLDDESPYVRGRAAEAFGLLGRSDSDVSVPDVTSIADDDAEQFLADRVRFAIGADDDGQVDGASNGIGSIEAIRERTDEVVSEMSSPDGDGCPYCGLSLPETGPPMCPRCGGPR